MADQVSRVVDWLDDVLAWLREPLTSMPIERVLERLRGTFRVNATSWTEQTGQVLTGMLFNPVGAMDAHLATIAEFSAGLYRDCHPLTVWYEQVPGTEPQTSGRVPHHFVPATRRAVLMTPLVEIGLEQQLTIYYRRNRTGARFFVLARDRHDFDADELAVARYVQRSLVTLDRQTEVLGRRGADQQDGGGRTDLGLTGRQLAVLQLLCDGLSTRQVARRLACSPRTVDKHLQHAYRKLDVRDRVNAMRLARLAGVVTEREPGPPGRSDARGEPH